MRAYLKTDIGFFQCILIYFQGMHFIDKGTGKNVISKDPLFSARNLKSISKMKRPLACERPFCL